MVLSISEILEKASQQKTKKDKIDFLRKNDSAALRSILKHALDPSIKFLLPDTDPPYKPLPHKEAYGMLYSQARKMYLFVEGGNPNLSQFKREMLFIEVLESLDPEDAKLLLAVKNKTIPYKGITRNLIKEAFENLL